MSFLQIPIQTYPNTALGYESSVSSGPAAIGNTAIGYKTLQENVNGYWNSAFGNLALTSLNGNPGFGIGNSAFGYTSLSELTIGTFNSAFGVRSMELATSGDFNSAFGVDALQALTTASNTTAIGSGALADVNASRNTSIGALSGGLLTSGTDNTFVGYGSGDQITTGSKNVVLGRYSGNQGALDIRTLSNYVVISDGDGNPRIIVDPAGLVSAPGGFSGGGGGGGALTFNNRTAAYTVVSGDLGKIVNCTSGTFTVSLTAAATLGSGFNCWVWNTGTGVITIDPNGAETIDGVSTLTLRQGEGSQIVCNGTNWETGDRKTMRGYAENLPSASARPSASGSAAVAIGSTATASGTSSFATNNSIASGTQSIALGGATASANYSTSIGQNSGNFGSQAVISAGAMALGGSYASGFDSFAAAINSTSSSYGALLTCAVAIGQNGKANNSNAAVFGGAFNVASGIGSVAIGGTAGTTASGAGAVAIGGANGAAVASAQNSIALGENATVPTVKGKFAFSSDGGFAVGGSQYGNLVLRRQTTDATASTLGSDGAAGAGTNQAILPNNSAQAFTGTVVARRQASGGTQSAAWTIEGLIRREGTAASTTLVTSTVTVISNVPGWTLALSADTVNGGLTITATGALATNIRWVATVQTSEVIYA